MKTVEEVLRETGLTDEQIKAIDAKPCIWLDAGSFHGSVNA
jgi:hypothetical protein